jgi:HAE1 family hydrophobic/amphiphilic exporter-1
LNLTGFCIRRPVTTGMFFFALIIIGLISCSRMPIDLFPEITFPALSVSTSYSGAGPEEVERLITIPIEQAVSTINGVKSITATSQEGSSRVTINFNWGYNLDAAANDIRANLDRAKRRLPDDAGDPTVFKFDPSMAPVLTLGLSGPLDEVTLRKLADEDLCNQLQRVDGVASVDVRGGKSREIRVFLKQDRLQALGLTASQVANAIRNENSMVPAGNLASGIGDFLLRTKGELQDLEELKNIIVVRREGTPVYLRDIATVEEGYEDVTSYTRIDGQPGIVLSVSKRSGWNTVAVADRVYKVLDEIRRLYPQIKLRVLNDSSVYIRSAVKSVAESALIGALLAGLILLFFLHNIRATLITGIAMPISIMATLIIAYFFKMTLNTISLGGLALGVGMLVDNAIVVLDNIFRHYHNNGGDIKAAALEGTVEMGPALSASTLTNVCVFLPLIFLTGRNGIIFKELSYMVIFSILCSLLVAVTLLPTLCAKFLKVSDLNEHDSDSVKGILIRTQSNWEKSYGGVLTWCLRHKWMVIIIGLAFFAGSMTLFPFIGTEMVQQTDEGVISVNLQMPTGTRLEETDRVTAGLEQQIVKNLPELANIETSVGGRASHQASLNLRLKPKAERDRTTQQVLDDLQTKLEVPGGRLRLSIRNSMRMLYGRSEGAIAVDIRGYDLQQARRVAGEVMELVAQAPGVTDVNMSREEERPELAITIDRKRAADYGVTAAEITGAVQINMEGKVATTFRRGGEEIEVRVNLEEADRGSWQDLGKILVSGDNGRVIPLSSLVRLVQTNSPVGIERKDQERNVTVNARLERRDLGSAMREIKKAVDQVKLPEGISIFYAGDYEEQQQAAKEFQIAILLALLLVYMVMAAQFESFFDPFVIMLSVPFALSGVLIMLILTDTLFNSQVYTGLIMLGGIVVNNAIVLISYYRIMMEKGHDLQTAVITGSKSRLRPVLMTTVTTILGLIPLALGFGEGSETQAPLARTVIGGLACSTVLTLILIPVIFTGLESGLAKMRQRFRKRGIAPTLGLFILLLGLVGFGALRPVTAAAPARQLTVDEAVKLALTNNEEGKIITTKREIAESAYQEIMGVKGIKLYSTLESVAGGEKNDSTELALTAEKSVPVANLVGAKSLADRIADFNREISLYAAEQQEQQFIYNVIAAFQKEVLAKRDLFLAEENSGRAARTYEEIMTRSKLGLTTVSDEIGAESQKTNAETGLNRSRQLYELAKMKLRQYLNLPAAEELDLVPPENDTTPLTLESLLSAARENRSDLKQAQTGVVRADALLKLARLSERLGINLSWNMVRDNFKTGLTLGNQSGSGSDSSAGEWKLSGSGGLVVMDPKDSGDHPEWGTLKLTMKWTFLDGKVRKERIKQAKLLVEQLTEEAKKAGKNLDYEVRDAYCTYLNQVDKLKSSELQLRYNKTYFESTQAKLRVGLASVKDLLDAQVLLSQAEVDLEHNQSDLYLSRINLMRVCGKLKA